jgi:protein SCO1/2
MGGAGAAPAVSSVPVGPPVGLPRLGAAPNFALTTSQGARLWLTQLRPRLVVLTFGCIGCEVCAGVLPTLADVARGLGDAAGRRVFFAFVTADPGRDTPAALRAFGRARRLGAPAWLFLTGEPGEIDAVLRRYDVPVRLEGDRVIPRCVTALVDGAGNLRAAYDATGLGRLRADLAAVLAEDSVR